MYDKLIELQAAIKAPKSQTNAFGKYNYRSCEDILEAVKPKLKELELALLLTDSIEVVGDRVYVKAEAILTDGNKTISNFAYAREPLIKKGMDESQITGAASSYARKYALAGLLLLDDNKDADTIAPADNDNYKALCDKHKATIQAVKDGIATDNLEMASEAWYELDKETMKSLWVAPTKGGCFSTKEREIMKTPEFRQAHYGADNE